MNEFHDLEQALGHLGSARIPEPQRERIWRNIEAEMAVDIPNNARRPRKIWTSTAAAAAAVALVAGGYAMQNRAHPMQTSSHPVNQASARGADSGVLYELHDYAAQAGKPTVPFYEDGKTVNESIPFQTSLAVAKEHSPWKTDPLQSAEVYTTNLLPQGFSKASWAAIGNNTLTTHVNGVMATYQLLTQNDTASPPTAQVELSVTGQGYQSFYLISLFQLNHRYVWDISRIVRSAAPPIQLPSRIKSLSIASGLAAVGYEPNHLNAVARQVTDWLQSASRTTYTLPQPTPNLVFNANVGPDTLFLTTQDGEQISIWPAYSIVKQGTGYRVVTQNDTIAYQTATEVAYLHCPGLYKWLVDHAWKSSFHMA